MEEEQVARPKRKSRQQEPTISRFEKLHQGRLMTGFNDFSTAMKLLLRTESPTTPDEWVEVKKKFPQYFGVTDTGDLTVPNQGGTAVDKVIHIPNRIPTTTEEIRAFLQTRAEQIKGPEERFAQAKRTLQSVLAGYRAGTHTKRDVVDANHEVHKAECELHSVARGGRSIKEEYDEVFKKELNFDWYDRKKISDSVFTCTITTFPWSAFWKDGPEGGPAIQPPQPVPTQADLARQEGGEPSDTQPNQPKSPSDPARIGAIIHARKQRAQFA